MGNTGGGYVVSHQFPPVRYVSGIKAIAAGRSLEASNGLRNEPDVGTSTISDGMKNNNRRYRAAEIAVDFF